jgi:lipoyl(octanoyl) transferase
MAFPQGEWRLLKSLPAHGAWNMAVDEAILQGVIEGTSSPTLRLYAWEPACVSLGIAQPISDLDRAALDLKGWEVVRRPTGGRAILHTDELTYAVIGPVQDPRLSGSVLESYRRLSLALLSALRMLDLPAEAHEKMPGNSSASNPVCFEVPSNYEITANGKKLIGSAQARRKDGVLQHGSLPLHGDITRLVQALYFRTGTNREAAAQRLSDRATTVEAILGRQVSWEEAAIQFKAAFEQVLNLLLIPTELSGMELRRAEQLFAEKYAYPSWTERV